MIARYGPRVTAAVLVATGAHLAWYWYPTATNGTATSSGGLARFSATVSTWIQAHTILVAVSAAIIGLAVTARVLRHRLRSRNSAPSTRTTTCRSPSRLPPFRPATGIRRPLLLTRPRRTAPGSVR